jgi:hypothetical protein
MSMESYYGHAGQHDITPATIASADMIASYSRAADIWINYYYGLVNNNGVNETDCTGNACLYPWYPKTEQDVLDNYSSDAAGSFWVSNCVGERQQYVERMTKRVKLHGWGTCLRAKVADTNGDKLVKKEVSSRYKFHLAFENYPLDDYVTEKLFQAITYKSVPVLWGAPTASFFEPGTHAFINAFDFKGPEELGDYLQYLNTNHTAYLEYFAWREHGGLSQRFLKFGRNNFSAYNKDSLICKACSLFAQRHCSVTESYPKLYRKTPRRPRPVTKFKRSFSQSHG